MALSRGVCRPRGREKAVEVGKELLSACMSYAGVEVGKEVEAWRRMQPQHHAHAPHDADIHQGGGARREKRRKMLWGHEWRKACVRLERLLASSYHPGIIEP